MTTLTLMLARREVGQQLGSRKVSMLKDSGIAISSTPIAVDDATADTAIFLMLGALRKITIPMTAIRDGNFRGKTPIGHDPKGKILGILGMGGIGRVSICQRLSVVPILTKDRQWQSELGPLV